MKATTESASRSGNEEKGQPALGGEVGTDNRDQTMAGDGWRSRREGDNLRLIAPDGSSRLVCAIRPWICLYDGLTDSAAEDFDSMSPDLLMALEGVARPSGGEPVRDLANPPPVARRGWQVTEAARMGVETLLSALHPAGASGWTLADEREARAIVTAWAEATGRTGSKGRQSRKGALQRIRRDGLEPGRVRFAVASHEQPEQEQQSEGAQP